MNQSRVAFVQTDGSILRDQKHKHIFRKDMKGLVIQADRIRMPPRVALLLDEDGCATFSCQSSKLLSFLKLAHCTCPTHNLTHVCPFRLQLTLLIMVPNA